MDCQELRDKVKDGILAALSVAEKENEKLEKEVYELEQEVEILGERLKKKKRELHRKSNEWNGTDRVVRKIIELYHAMP